MGIKVSWYNDDKTIVIWEYEGQWEWRDYHAAINQAVIMLKSVDQKVDSIMDLRRSAQLPANALIQGQRWFVVAPENFGVTVVTGANWFITQIAKTIAGLFPRFKHRVLFAATLEEALQLLLKGDQSGR